MKIPGNLSTNRMLWMISVVAVLTAAAALLYPAVRGNKVYAAQEKAAPRSAAGNQPTSLNDKPDLNVPVNTSNIALIRDARNPPPPTATFPQKFMNTAPPVTPATVHFR